MLFFFISCFLSRLFQAQLTNSVIIFLRMTSTSVFINSSLHFRDCFLGVYGSKAFAGFWNLLVETWCTYCPHEQKLKDAKYGWGGTRIEIQSFQRKDGKKGGRLLWGTFISFHVLFVDCSDDNRLYCRDQFCPYQIAASNQIAWGKTECWTMRCGELKIDLDKIRSFLIWIKEKVYYFCSLNIQLAGFGVLILDTIFCFLGWLPFSLCTLLP